MRTYGKELVLDIHNCDSSTFTRESIKKYFKEVCAFIGVKRRKLCWWDDHGVPPEEQETEPHLKGTTAIQFLSTSNITIHTLDLMKRVYLNIFSCKDFDEDAVRDISEKWFRGEIASHQVVERI